MVPRGVARPAILLLLALALLPVASLAASGGAGEETHTAPSEAPVSDAGPQKGAATGPAAGPATGPATAASPTGAPAGSANAATPREVAPDAACDPAIPEPLRPDVACGFTYHVIGDPADAQRTTTPGLALMGGGADQDEAFRFLTARSGGGDILVLRATGTDAYNPYIYGLDAVDSVETLVVPTRDGAERPWVHQKVNAAEAVFIAGGDQWDYMREWSGTGLAAVLGDLAGRGTPIGGTSAGLAILGEHVFSASAGTVHSDEALADPYHPAVTLDRSFAEVPMLAGAITDSHFSERNRTGRLVTFMARLAADGHEERPRGLGVDEATAVLVDQTGSARVVGNASAWFLHAPEPPGLVDAGTPVEHRLSAYVLHAGQGLFDIERWRGAGGTRYTLEAEAGQLAVAPTLATQDVDPGVPGRAAWGVAAVLAAATIAGLATVQRRGHA